MGHTQKKAIFSGRFDPFHIGHAYAIKRSLEIVDDVLVYLAKPAPSGSKIVASLDERTAILQKWLDANSFGGQVELYRGNKKHTDLHKAGYNIEICGSDIFNYYKNYQWKSFVLTREFIVIQRSGWGLTMPVLDEYLKRGGLVHIIPGLNDGKGGDYNSTSVRHMLKYNKKIRGMVPPELGDLIEHTYAPKLRPSDATNL